MNNKESQYGNNPPENNLLEKLKEKKEPSLGELNPLLFPPDLENPEAVEALTLVTRRKIIQYSGLQPTSLESARAFDRNRYKEEPRLVIRFETDSLSEGQLSLLENLVRETYGKSVKTRRGMDGGSVPPSGYPLLEQSSTKKSGNQNRAHLGWYMGSNGAPLEGTHQGLFVYRDLGNSGMGDYLRNYSYKEWFFKDNLVTPMGKPIKTKYLVEIREAGLYQTDIVEFITQVSVILSTGALINNPRLKYEIYNDLNRLGLKKTQREDVIGLDEEIDRLERVLIIPLANLDASAGIDLRPASVLLVGVPGTGKTLVIEYFLQQDTGIFILPIDPKHLAEDLAAPPEKKRIIPRISEVFKRTQIPVILHIDDIENIAQNEQAINSTMLNLMAGVRESGFFVIASTNYPEKLTPQLLQPQRFAHVIYFGLHSEAARRKILENNAIEVSKQLGKPLFNSVMERTVILDQLSRLTENFTPRFLAEICTEAKSFYLRRISQLKARKIGLLEDDLDDRFSIEDWEKAFIEVQRKYDQDATVKRDKELREFAERFRRQFGFLQEPGKGQIISFRKTVEDELVARLEKITS